LIQVADTGPGMGAAPVPPALEAWGGLGVRAGAGAGTVRGARVPHAGLGIGLPLTRALAQANGAALTIDSAPGRGTCATIAFGPERLRCR